MRDLHGSVDALALDCEKCPRVLSSNLPPPRRDAKLDLANLLVEGIPHDEDSVFFGNLARGVLSSNLPPPAEMLSLI